MFTQTICQFQVSLLFIYLILFIFLMWILLAEGSLYIYIFNTNLNLCFLLNKLYKLNSILSTTHSFISVYTQAWNSFKYSSSAFFILSIINLFRTLSICFFFSCLSYDVFLYYFNSSHFIIFAASFLSFCCKLFSLA